MLLLPHQGHKGISLVKSLKRNLNKYLPNNVKAQVTFTGQCPEQNCIDNYLGESARRISERIIDHGGRDQKSHLLGML